MLTTETRWPIKKGSIGLTDKRLHWFLPANIVGSFTLFQDDKTMVLQRE